MTMDQHDDNLDCNEAVHVLYHYLDGELTEERRALIQAHLESCPPCFEGYEFEYELRQVIARKCREQVPEALLSRVADAIKHERLRPDSPSGF
jgi:mycothiol system anti-sigma-R factor